MYRFTIVLKRIGIGAGLLLVILLLLNALFGWSTGIRLQRRLAELRRSGEPVQLGDLARKPIPPERNAEAFVRRARNDLDSIQKDLDALYPRSGYPTEILTDSARVKLEKLFAAHANAIPLLVQAAACPDSDPALDFSLPTTALLNPYLDHVSSHRRISRILRARSVLLLSQGSADDALYTDILALRLVRHWLREPLIVAYLTSLACEAMAFDGINHALRSGSVSPAARQALDAELALHDTMEGYNTALRTERAYTLTSTREMTGSLAWVSRGFVNDVLLRFIGLYDGYLENGTRPYVEGVSGKGAPPPARFVFNPYMPLVKLLEPGLATIRQPTERAKAMSRCLRILNALQLRDRSGNAGTPRVSDLGLPAAMTVDPFSGESLLIKQLTGRWIVYSVGANLVDDGGVLEKNLDVGAAGSRPTP
jgi:hypothetical protein